MFYQRNKYVLVLVALAFFAGWVADAIYSKNNASDNYYPLMPIRENPPEYKYISPILYIDNSDVKYPRLDPLKNELADYIAKAKQANDADRVSVYYRDLSTNMWTGADENELYMPSSMLKTLILITYLKLADDNPAIFDEMLSYKKSVNEGQHYPPPEFLADGMYNVKVLLGRSIIYSDNDANDALSIPIDQKLSDFYAKMQFPKLPDKLEDYLSPIAMSRVFRTLFNSSYLSESYSEQALELLTKTTFTKGLTAGVDEGIAVAHKFGEYTKYPATSLESTSNQLHDCGIIYYPKKPYVLCVMTEGKSFDNLEKIIGDVSKITFSYIKSQ